MEGHGHVIDVQTHLPKDLYVEATHAGLFEIFMNLILNAVDALSLGGTIEIRAEQRGQTVHTTFSDTGAGMDEEIRRRVFEPFFTTKANVGTGLGLSMVYGAISRWEGTIEVESQPGRGTTFTIDLPASQPKKREEHPDIEHETFVRELLKRILCDNNSVDVFENGRAALAAFRPDKYDVALIDLGLPEIPGDRLAKEIRQVDPAVARVLITGWQLADDDPRLAPFDFHLQKPFERTADLRRIVSRALALNEERRAQD
jgi:CheY-like chemotaxis protein/anti-sigma regulatory factor (Ser/Thr protein kinase)